MISWKNILFSLPHPQRTGYPGGRVDADHSKRHPGLGKIVLYIVALSASVIQHSFRGAGMTKGDSHMLMLSTLYYRGSLNA